MDLVSRVTQNFHDNLNATQIALEVMSEPLVSAGEALTNCLLSGGKVITCGNAGSSALADYMASLMLGKLQLPRPALPAISLSCSTVITSSIADAAGQSQVYAGQLSALGQHDDTLFIISQQNDDVSLLAAAREAHDRGMRVIVLSAESGDELSASLRPEDIEISIPTDNDLRTHEIQVLAVHCICDLIDNQLMGLA